MQKQSDILSHPLGTQSVLLLYIIRDLLCGSGRSERTRQSDDDYISIFAVFLNVAGGKKKCCKIQLVRILYAAQVRS